jgi:hypothetical protein
MTNVLGRGLPYRVQNRSDSIKMFSESDIIKMLDIFKIDIIFVQPVYVAPYISSSMG